MIALRQMPMCKRLLLASVTAILAAAAPMAAEAQPLRLNEFFNGKFAATGELDNYRDNTQRPFKATLQGKWTGSTGTLAEDIVFADGERRHIAWTMERTGEGRIVGHRDDLIGDADVTSEDDGIRMRYKARTRLPSGKIWNLSFDDRLQQISPTRVTVTSDISYLFIGVGVTHMTIDKIGR